MYKKEGKIEQSAQPRPKFASSETLLQLATRAVLTMNHVTPLFYVRFD